VGKQKVLLQGYLRKLKTMKKKYFVVYDDAPNKPGTGRLEYYDSEKKFRQMLQKNNENATMNPKRSIVLRTCFNINRRTDVKLKYIIGLYKKDDCFSIVLESEEELNLWLKTLLILQRGEEFADGAPPRPTFGEFLFIF
jgi:insulin receptor substrate 1